MKKEKWSHELYRHTLLMCSQISNVQTYLSLSSDQRKRDGSGVLTRSRAYLHIRETSPALHQCCTTIATDQNERQCCSANELRLWQNSILNNLKISRVHRHRPKAFQLLVLISISSVRTSIYLDSLCTSPQLIRQVLTVYIS